MLAVAIFRDGFFCVRVINNRAGQMLILQDNF
jgi:hypothetical protein